MRDEDTGVRRSVARSGGLVDGYASRAGRGVNFGRLYFVFRAERSGARGERYGAGRDFENYGSGSGDDERLANLGLLSVGLFPVAGRFHVGVGDISGLGFEICEGQARAIAKDCLLYTSDAADE